MPGTMTAPPAGKQSTFKIHSNGAVKAYKRQNPETGATEYIIESISSSNVRDRHGDTITERAQQSMLKQAQGLTMFLNHSYNVPEDVLGTCEYSTLERNGDIVDLVTRCNVAQSNPRAMDCWRLINEDKVKLGESIGGNITESEVDEENDDGESWCPPLIINDIELLEISLCGIPANPRSYTRDFVSQMARGYMRSATRSPKVRELVRKALSGTAKADLDALLDSALKSEDPVASALSAIDENGMQTVVKDWLSVRGEQNARKLLGDEAFDAVAKAVGFEVKDVGGTAGDSASGAASAATATPDPAPDAAATGTAGDHPVSPDSTTTPSDTPPADPAEPGEAPEPFLWASADGTVTDLSKLSDAELRDLMRKQLAEHSQVSERDALKSEIDTLQKQRDTLRNECEDLVKNLAEIKATPTGRQTKTATSGGSSGETAILGIDLTKLTNEELLQVKRRIARGEVAVDGRSLAQQA